MLTMLSHCLAKSQDTIYRPRRMNESEYIHATQFERETIEVAVRDYQGMYTNFSHRKPSLCTTFIGVDGSEEKYHFTRNILFGNIRVTPCDWIVLFYDGVQANASHLKSQLCNHIQLIMEVNSSRSLIYCGDCSYLQNSSAYIERHIHNYTALNYFQSIGDIVKPMMHMDLIPYLKDYQKVFVLDSDIDLSHFDFSLAMHIWNCSIYPPPLVIQPVIDGPTAIQVQRWYHWKSRSDKVNMYIFPSVEQQAPFFDSIFLEWFLSTIERDDALPYHIGTGHDVGADSIWCGAAQAFGEAVLGYKNYKSFCGYIIGAGPAYHRDTRTLKKDVSFKKRGVVMLFYYWDSYYHW